MAVLSHADGGVLVHHVGIGEDAMPLHHKTRPSGRLLGLHLPWLQGGGERGGRKEGREGGRGGRGGGRERGREEGREGGRGGGKRGREGEREGGRKGGKRGREGEREEGGEGEGDGGSKACRIQAGCAGREREAG